jgi:hypothetical protein
LETKVTCFNKARSTLRVDVFKETGHYFVQSKHSQ